jgi:hypothetical protein
MKAPNLWQIMFSAVRSFNYHELVLTLESDCSILTGTHTSDNDFDGIDNPITKWHYYEPDPDDIAKKGENNNNNDSADSQPGGRKGRGRRFDGDYQPSASLASSQSSDSSINSPPRKRHKASHHQTKNTNKSGKRHQEKEIKDHNRGNDDDDDDDDFTEHMSVEEDI